VTTERKLLCGQKLMEYMDILILTPQKLILEEHAKQYLKA
jgi:hypothetical protein